MIPGMKGGLTFVAIVGAVLLTVAVLNGFERPPIVTQQDGYRGTGAVENYNPRTLAALRAANVNPTTLPPLGAVGPSAGKVYKNVKVLGGLSVGQFTRLMASITNWVSPAQGCAYCHDTKNMASDAKYTKVVSRRMLEMVQQCVYSRLHSPPSDSQKTRFVLPAVNKHTSPITARSPMRHANVLYSCCRMHCVAQIRITC